MRTSRGMGIMNKAKLPKAVLRKDATVPTKLYKTGGKVKKFDEGGQADDGYRGEPDEGIEPVYPVENLLLGGPRVAGKLLGAATKGIGKIAKQVDLLRRPKVNNYMAPEILLSKNAAQEGQRAWGVRNVFNPKEIEDIKKSGYMLPSPKEVASGRNRKWFTETDTPINQHLRVKRENIPSNRAVRRKDVEMFNEQTGQYEPLKKGGKVKSKPGLYANIHAKRARIAAGSGEKMRKVGSPGAPTAKAFKQSAKTAKKR